MPFAWYIGEGTKLKNKTTGDLYEVKRIIDVECFKGQNISGKGLFLSGTNSPLEGALYTDRRVLVEFDLSEESDVAFTDLLDGRNRFFYK